MPHGKPAPDVYTEAMRRQGADPERTAVIEDSEGGILAGKAAGASITVEPSVTLSSVLSV